MGVVFNKSEHDFFPAYKLSLVLDTALYCNAT